MTTSATIGHTAREVRSTRRIGSGEERRTVRVRTARCNTVRRAIADSAGWR